MILGQRIVGEPDDLPVHPWLVGQHSSDELAAELRYPARALWWAREIHREDFAALRAKPAEHGSFREWESGEVDDGFGSELVWDTVDLCSALAADRLGGAAALVWAGEYLFSLEATVRASFEASLTGCWVLSGDLSPQERIWRAELLQYNDLSRLIASASDRDLRGDLKAARRKHKASLIERHGQSNVQFDDGGSNLVALGTENVATWTAMARDLARRLGHDGQLWTRYYDLLSQLTHPNASTTRILSTSSGSYRKAPEEVRQVLRVGVFAYSQLLRHAAGWAFHPERGDPALGRWEQICVEAFPDYFVDDVT